LARDVTVLLDLAKHEGCDAALLRSVKSVNDRQNALVVDQVRRLFGAIDSLCVGVLGLTYKAGTSTMRRSAAMEIADLLIRAGATVKAFDPKAESGEIPELAGLVLCEDAYETAAGSSALILMTAWPEFMELDLERLSRVMASPTIVDPNNSLDPARIEKAGFRYVGRGRGTYLTA
jgi:UDPglucose 6-dehydrogenase